MVCACVSGDLFNVPMETKGQLWVSSSIILHLILRHSLSLFCSLPGSEAQDPLASSSPSELKEHAAMPVSYLGTGDVNSGPYNCAARTLSIEPSS